MNKIALSFAILGLSAGAVFAQAETDFAVIDTDTSGEISFAEAQIVWPELTQEEFDAADADTSGGLSTEEFDAYQSSSTEEVGTTPVAPAATAPAAPAAAAPSDTATPGDAPAATDIDSGSTSSSENENAGGDAGAGN